MGPISTIAKKIRDVSDFIKFFPFLVFFFNVNGELKLDLGWLLSDTRHCLIANCSMYLKNGFTTDKIFH